jgi:hypothetical protein
MFHLTLHPKCLKSLMCLKCHDFHQKKFPKSHEIRLSRWSRASHLSREHRPYPKCRKSHPFRWSPMSHDYRECRGYLSLKCLK